MSKEEAWECHIFLKSFHGSEEQGSGLNEGGAEYCLTVKMDAEYNPGLKHRDRQSFTLTLTLTTCLWAMGGRESPWGEQGR